MEPDTNTVPRKRNRPVSRFRIISSHNSNKNTNNKNKISIKTKRSILTPANNQRRYRFISPKEPASKIMKIVPFLVVIAFSFALGDATADAAQKNRVLEPTNYCGISWTDAQNSCGQTCPGGQDSDCPTGQRCFGGIACSNSQPPTPGPSTTTNYCGASWSDAATSCGNACPGGLDSECPSGTQCYADVSPCHTDGGNEAPAPTPLPTPNPTPTPTTTDKNTNYCGTSWSDAAATCGTTCPGGLDSECPPGTQCYDVTSCHTDGGDETPAPTLLPTPVPTSSPTTEGDSYCGVSWEDAAEACNDPCPNGQDVECPEGMLCFPNVTPCTVGGENETPKVEFKGIRDIFSMERGVIELDWLSAILIEPTTSNSKSAAPSSQPSSQPSSILGGAPSSQPSSEPSSIPEPIYDVFVATSGYNFLDILSNNSIPDLIEIFDNETLLHHYEVVGAESLLITSDEYGEEKSVLVTAQIDGFYSSNKIAHPVTVAISSPHIRDEINLVGLFVPTTMLEIRVSESSPDSPHQLVFAGSVSSEAQNLVAGDYITGFDSDLFPFIRRIVSVSQTSSSLVDLLVVQVPLEGIFDELDLSGALEVARRNDGLDQNGRRLFFGKVVGWVKDRVSDLVNIIDDAIGTFFEFVEDIGQGIIDTFRLMFGEEVTKDFEVIDVEEEFDYGLIPDLVHLTGEINFEASLVVGVQVNADKLSARAGIEVEYSCAAMVEMKAEAETDLIDKEYTILSGKRQRKGFFVGPVPVEVYWQPKVELVTEVKARASASSTVGVTASGNTEISAVFDTSHSPVFYERYIPPSFDTDYILPQIAAEAGVAGSTAIVISVDVGLYEGLLEVNAGLSLGLAMDIAVGLESVGFDELVPTLNAFDFGIEFKIPFSGEALYGEHEIFETTLFETTWPIIKLPSADLQLSKEHRCLLADTGSYNQAILSIEAIEDYPDDAVIKNGFASGSGKWWLHEESPGWYIGEDGPRTAVLENNGVTGAFSPPPQGTVTYAVEPKIPPLPLKILQRVPLGSLVGAENIQCTEPSSCDGDVWFDKLQAQVAAEFNSEIFLSQPPDPNAPPVPSRVYKFEDFMTALKNLQDADDTFQFWVGDDCSIESQKAAIVNMAAFLGQAMRETIIYDACDENNWDKWRADVYKEPESPDEILSYLYPMSAGCGQLGQRYADYRCEDECPQDLSMEITATTNAGWIGAPPPLVCGPKSKYDGLGYWNPHMFCQGPDNTCDGQQFSYSGQAAGVHIPVADDNRFPMFFYSNPLPDANGNSPEARSPDAFPPTNVEGCCWWGRGVIQTTGRCNFGKLNKYLGAGAGANALYPEINFCKNPQAVCDGPSDLKWVAGIFFWVSDPQKYDRDGFNYKDGVNEFVQMGCADNPDLDGCDFLFEYASGIVNRGCHDPGEAGCPGCVPGATCDPAHNIPERVEASKQALRGLMKILVGDDVGPSPTPPAGPEGGTCGGGSVGDGICPNQGDCCSPYGWCGTSSDHCGGSNRNLRRYIVPNNLTSV